MGFITDLLTNISAFRIKVGEKLNWLNSQIIIAKAIDFNGVLNNGNITTYQPIFNRGTSGGAKFILRSQSTVGNNYYSFENSLGVETHYVGLGSSGSDNFSFYTLADNDWLFYSNGNQIFKINDQSVQSYRNVVVPDATANNHAVTLGQVNGFLGGFVKADGTVAMTDSLPFDNNWKIGASAFQTGSFPFYFNGDTVAVLNQNGTLQIADATANNHAVTLGQISGLTSNKANINGSNTAGGSWKIDYILSDILGVAIGNSQVLNVLGNGTIHYGNNGVAQHRFISSTIYGLTVEVPGYGVGVVWHEFNYDPSTKADTTGNYPLLYVGGGDNWGNGYNNIFGGVSGTSGIDYLYGYNSGTGKGHILTIADFQTVIGLGNYALLSQVYTQSQALSLFVGLNGVQTIADTKTFTSSPIVPNGTLIGHTVNLGQLLAFDYQNASQVSTTVTNQITNLGFAPNPHRYFPVTANNTVIDPSEHRRIVAVFTNPSVLGAVLPNNAFPGTVVTLQTTSTSVSVTMDYRRPGSSGSSLTMEPNKSLQMSFSEDESAWIFEQYNDLT